MTGDLMDEDRKSMDDINALSYWLLLSADQGSSPYSMVLKVMTISPGAL
jgi:hypothetical protein